MPFCPNSLEFPKNNARNITHMDALIFRKFFDFEQVGADSEMPILGQAPIDIILFSSHPFSICWLCLSSESIHPALFAGLDRLSFPFHF